MESNLDKVPGIWLEFNIHYNSSEAIDFGNAFD